MNGSRQVCHPQSNVRLRLDQLACPHSARLSTSTRVGRSHLSEGPTGALKGPLSTATVRSVNGGSIQRRRGAGGVISVFFT